LLALAAIAFHFNAKPRHDAFAADPDVVRGLAAVVVLFGVSGFGLVRLALPAALRRYEPLWILPTGACAVGLALTVLGFAGLPYPVSLALVLAAGAALGGYAVRRRGWPEVDLRRLAWPAFLAFVITLVALVPMVFRLHYAAPTGTGSDAHMAAGVAQFLKHDYPTSVDTSQPVNQMWPVWQSKYPIYYAFAGISSLSGLATWQLLPILAAALLGLAAVGLFLAAREVFRAPVAASVVAMAVAALDREALATVLHPYFNQTWGFFALPFTIVLGWWVVQPRIGRRARQGTGLLLALFALVLVLAYPLAAPIPAVPIAVFVWHEWRRKIAAGEPVFRLRNLYRGRRSLLWLVPLGALLAVPVAGAVDKGVSAAEVLAPGHSLQNWAGDLFGFIPFNYFFSLPSAWPFVVVVVAIAYLAARGLAAQPRALAWGLGGLLVLGVAIALYLRQRSYGWYFHFKLLAFIGPLVLLTAAVGATRLRRAGPAALAALCVATTGSAVAQIGDTGLQLGAVTTELSGWAAALPKGVSIRLDMWAPDQLWAAYFLDSRPLCSQLPLLGTDYPHVPISRKADYIVAMVGVPRPPDAVGPALRRNEGYRLFRENPAVPGVANCSVRRLDRLYSGAGHSPY
jgi:hypothetical protein